MTTRSTKSQTILGIDPGTLMMGFGVIQTQGSSMKLQAVGCINLKKHTDPYTKLHIIFEKVQELIHIHAPDSCAIEAPFYGKNAQSMLKLGRAQGVAIAAAIAMELEVTEYSPKKIKMSLTGNGNASKEQVAAMIQQLFKMDKMPTYMDATDALATAICHHFQLDRPSLEGKRYSGWDAFIKANPDKAR